MNAARMEVVDLCTSTGFKASVHGKSMGKAAKLQDDRVLAHRLCGAGELLPYEKGLSHMKCSYADTQARRA